MAREGILGAQPASPVTYNQGKCADSPRGFFGALLLREVFVTSYDTTDVSELILPKISADLCLEIWQKPTQAYRGFL